MIKLIVFHSGNPAWRSCQTAIGVAKSMKKNFEDSIDLNIYTNDSQEAKEFQIRSSTNVFANGEGVPLDMALSKDKMKAFLQEKMWAFEALLYKQCA